jgi:hypothetical protein
VYHSAFGAQINNFMITEKSNLRQTNFILSFDKTPISVVLKDLLDKIKTKQKEPFAKIYITFPPTYFLALLGLMKTNEIPVKNIAHDKTNFYMEI